MNRFYYPQERPILQEVLSAYDLPETLVGAVPYGHGLINETYCVLCQPRSGDCVRFILQRINSAVFPEPMALMKNMSCITAYLREKILDAGGDPSRETLTLIRNRAGKDHYVDSTGEVWRMVLFIEGVDCPQKASPELFETSARTFGRFQRMLQGYPAATLCETIEKFHDTEDRFAKFEAALADDAAGRAGEVQEEIRFALDRKADCSVVMQALRDGKLPLRVTHNDTKLNNLLIDRATGEGVCVLDLDTTMPGLVINDFGDSIRFGANHCAEDEPDLSKVNFDIRLYECFLRGFLEGTQGCLTHEELEYLPWGARLMTLENGIRFLTDYLNGDRYFRVCDPEQNLRRCRTQFKLVRDMEQQFQTMQSIVWKYAD